MKSNSSLEENTQISTYRLLASWNRVGGVPKLGDNEAAPLLSISGKGQTTSVFTAQGQTTMLCYRLLGPYRTLQEILIQFKPLIDSFLVLVKYPGPI